MGGTPTPFAGPPCSEEEGVKWVNSWVPPHHLTIHLTRASSVEVCCISWRPLKYIVVFRPVENSHFESMGGWLHFRPYTRKRCFWWKLEIDKIKNVICSDWEQENNIIKWETKGIDNINEQTQLAGDWKNWGICMGDWSRSTESIELP